MTPQPRFVSLPTVADVAKAFGVTTITIMNWRKYAGMPHIVFTGGERPAIRFDPDEVRTWAADTGRMLKRPKMLLQKR